MIIFEFILFMIFRGVTLFIIKNFLLDFLIFFYVFGLFFLRSIFVGCNSSRRVFLADRIRVNLCILTFWVSLLIVFSRIKIKKIGDFFLEYRWLISLLSIVLIIAFLVKDIFSFYFFFEVSILPTIMIIMGWGYQPERFQASVYFFFYTIVGSLPLLLVILFIFINLNIIRFDFFLIGLKRFKRSFIHVFLGLFGLMAFIIKMPIFYTHLWLPKAHVEAPVAGSMILAGVLLKLGGYGMIRIIFLFLRRYLLKLKFYFWGLRLVGMIFIGILCCRINDFKALVAYSSVAHIAIVIAGLIRLTFWGLIGAFIIIIAHGLSSSGLFCIVNIYYERTRRRRFFLNKGLISIYPIFSLIIFILRAANIAAPPSINLLSEIILIIRIIKIDYFIILVFPLGSFLGAVFTLFIFSYSQHGILYNRIISRGLRGFREFHLLIIHIIPLNFLILNTSLFLEINIYLNSLLKILICGFEDSLAFK